MLRTDIFREDYPPVLSTSSGPVCKLSQQPTSPVRVSVPRPRSNGNGCIPLQLESVAELDFSSSSLHPEDPNEQAQSGQSYSPGPSSPLERIAVVSHNAGDVSGLPEMTPSTTGANQSPLRSRGRTPTPAQAIPGPDRVAISRGGLWGAEEAATDILLSSWSKATQQRCTGPRVASLGRLACWMESLSHYCTCKLSVELPCEHVLTATSLLLLSGSIWICYIANSWPSWILFV